MIEGAFKQCVIATDRRVIVFKKGLMAGTAFGSKVTSWKYRNITGIQLETRMNSGALIIRAAGEESISASYWKSGKGSAQEAPNAIVFAAKPNMDVQNLVARLSQFVTEAHAPAQQQSAAPESAMDQLRKLGELRDAGVVTPEEFERKKQELLGRI